MSLTEKPGASRARGPEGEPRESDELYRLLAEHSTDMISRHTPSGVYAYASPACRALLGYEPEDLLGRDAYELFHPADLAEVRKTHAAILERPDTRTVAYRIRRKDGSYTWFETTSRTVRDPHTNDVLEIVAVSRDITERKKAEAMLREAETRYRTLVEQIPAMIYVDALDDVNSSIYTSPQAEDMLGTTPEEWLADPELFVKLLHPDDRERVLSEHARANETGAPLKTEYRLRTREGRAVWVRDESVVIRDGRGRLLFRQGVMLDITERKRAEEASKEALGDAKRYASQLRGLTDAAPVVNSAHSVDEMLQTITEQAREVIGAHRCVTSLTIDENRARPIDAISLSDQYAERHAHARIPGCSDESADEQLPPRGWLAAPLIGRDGRNIGSIQLSDKLEGDFDETDEAVLVQFTQMASAALENARLYQQAHSTIDSLSAHVAILDESGTIVATNRAWRRFAQENSPGDVSTFVEGINYLRVCDSATGPYSEESSTFADGIRAVLAGKRRMFELEYPCHSLEQQRWFVGRVTRFPDTEPPRVVVAHEDITARRRTEEELRESEERFRAFFETAAVGAAHADPATGSFLQVNEKLCRFLGYERAELLSRTFSDITHPDDRADGLQGLSRLLRGEIREYAAEKRYVRKDGQTVWGQLAVSLVRDANGLPLHTVAITQDITERRRLEESLREIREAERRRIARDLHDAVLQDLAGALQGMQAARVESPELGSELEQEIAALRRAVGSLRDAIYDLRAEKDQTFVRAVESLAELNRQMTPDREISLSVDDGFPPELPGGADVELLRVLQEALVNARRHSDARRVEVILSTGGRGVRAEVADDGVGFDPASIREGVGLSGMRERVSALGGKLEVRSEPGKGTAIGVEVPPPDPR